MQRPRHKDVRPGQRNLITDVGGLRVGNAQDHDIRTGVTVLVGDRPFVAALDVMGGAPGTRETDLLSPDRLVEDVDAIVLAGGSAFGLDAGSGVANALRVMGRGFRVGEARVPIVPAAILFDLGNGGSKAWAENPYGRLGAEALAAAAGDFALGTAGCGTGALTANLKGGLGSASLVLGGGHVVGALAGVNATGTATMGDRANFWAAPFEVGGEFGGLGPWPEPLHFADTSRTKRGQATAMANTTIAVVATDAELNKAQCRRMAVAAQDGIARALSPAHSLVDGDAVFAVATGQRRLEDSVLDIIDLGHAAAVCLSRAIARAVYHATPAPGDRLPTWRERFGR